MSHRTRLSPLAALFLALAMALIGASATEAKSTGGPIDVPASWGPQALGWGDLAWFRSSTRRASCVALEHDGWTVLANLGWLHRLVVASPHGDNSVASKARAHLLAHWALFRRDARALIRAGEACPKTLAGRERLAAKIAGTPSGEQAPGWAHRMFELFAVLYPHSASESCALLTPKIAAAQKDLASGPAQAKYFGRTRMTTPPPALARHPQDRFGVHRAHRRRDGGRRGIRSSDPPRRARSGSTTGSIEPTPSLLQVGRDRGRLPFGGG